MAYTKIFAHRGASGYAPENTISAFKKAIDLKADGIELDVHLSKDGKLVVMHDENLKRTTNKTGLISDYTLSELKQFDAGSWFSSEFQGEKIPTLEEVFDLICPTDLIINIEIKSGYRIYPNIEQKVLKCIKDFNMKNRCIISSFDHYSLVRVKELEPNIKTGLLYGESLYEPWEYAKSVSVNALHPDYNTFDKDFIKEAFKHKFEINPYTVNNDDAIKFLASNMITGIITNYPDKARKIVESIQE